MTSFHPFLSHRVHGVGMVWTHHLVQKVYINHERTDLGRENETQAIRQD